MGADMVIGTFLVREGEKLNDILDGVRKRIDQLTEENESNIEEIFENYFGDTKYRTEDDELDIDYIKEKFHTIVNDVHSVITEGRRDVTYIQHKGDVIYISGGMSWGDSPTDSCDLFDKYSILDSELPQEDRVNRW